MGYTLDKMLLFVSSEAIISLNFLFLFEFYLDIVMKQDFCHFK